MRVYSIAPSFEVKRNCGSASAKKTEFKNERIDFNKSMMVSFTGNDLHDVHHAVSVSVEDASVGLGMYKCGGQGVVAQQLPDALNKHTDMVVKKAIPYYCYNNPQGGIKVLYIPKEYDLERLPDKMPENLFLEYPTDKSIEEIAKLHQTTPDRIKFVIQDAPESVANPQTYIDPKTKETKALKESPYRILIPTEASGAIQRIDEVSLDKLKTIPYRVYRVALPKGKDADGKVIYDSDSMICVHTKDFAKFEKAYSYSPELKDHPHINLFTRDFVEATVDATAKLDTKEFGNFKPANIIGHCRTGFQVTEAVINRSQKDKFFRGFKIVDIFHNPMENYQGNGGSTLDFLRYKATAEDYQKLISLPEFPQLLAADSHRGNLSEEEAKLVDKIIKPFLQHYVDEKGTYNLQITPLIARKINPENISANHVSHTFANEAVALDDLARGLTGLFREAEEAGDKIPGRPNGCNIAGMKINDTKATMGKNNGLSADMSWYTPYDPAKDSAKTIVEAKRKNTKALLDMVGKASEGRLDKLSNFTNASLDDPLNKLLYSDDLIRKNRYVLGGLSAFHEKDVLWMSWGRSDSQKGYPILMEGFYRFLKNKNVPEEYILHAKIFLGSGPDPWEMDDHGVGDFHKIKDIMYKIQTLEDGKFKLNTAYGNGFFPNRLVTCATYGMFTSTGEPQGLTVPECLQTGTPTGSLNTGGAGEMIIGMEEDAQKTNGFKTKHPYMRNVKDLVTDEAEMAKLQGDALEDARLSAAADEVAEMFERMVKVYHEQPEVYARMVENGGRSQFDWHNNHSLNNGRSTLELYMEDAMEIQKGMEGRNKKPLNRLVGEFGGKFEALKRVVIKKTQDVVEKIVPTTDKVAQKVRNKWTSGIIWMGAVIAAVGTATYAYVTNKNHKSNRAA